MTIPVETVRSAVERALVRHGATAEDSRIIADALLEAELRGRPTHGLPRLPGILNVYKAGPREAPQIVREEGATALFDGRDHLGYIVMFRMAEKAVEVAKRAKVAVVAARNSRHAGMLGYYVSWMAERGVIGIAFANCWPLMAPWGGAERVLGTNPIAAAFPAEPYPILVDLGTAAITQGAVALARALGKKLPPDCALDNRGKPTRDPVAASDGAFLPFGGHKGYALAVMVQLLTGPFTGASPIPLSPQDYGHLVIGLLPDTFGDKQSYLGAVAEVCRRIKSARRMKGFDEILLPGERAYRERERRLRTGIEVPEDIWREVMKASEPST